MTPLGQLAGVLANSSGSKSDRIWCACCFPRFHLSHRLQQIALELRHFCVNNFVYLLSPFPPRL
jgi:hypothetical protein